MPRPRADLGHSRPLHHLDAVVSEVCHASQFLYDFYVLVIVPISPLVAAARLRIRREHSRMYRLLSAWIESIGGKFEFVQPQVF